MGQDILDAPSVEGWHTGKEWIDGGTLTERVNYAINTLNDPNKPGVQAIVARIRADGDTTTPEQLVDSVLDLIGPMEVEEETRETLVAHVETDGPLDWGSDDSANTSTNRVVQLLTLVVSAREYQFN
jgi:ATP-dependent Clp protease adapter protein ClpS